MRKDLTPESEMKEKLCAKCKEVKPIDSFSRKSSRKDGLNCHCKSCVNEKNKMYYKDNKDKLSEKNRENNKKYYKNNKESILARNSDYHYRNKDDRNAKARLRRLNNPDKYKKIYRDYYENKKKLAPSFVAEKSANRSASILLRSVQWANKEKISRIYAIASKVTRITGIPHEVDHVYPLNGLLISGLHVEGNLRVVSRNYNRAKCNKLMEFTYA